VPKKQIDGQRGIERERERERERDVVRARKLCSGRDPKRDVKVAPV
jgi:hypothetical protein